MKSKIETNEKSLDHLFHDFNYIKYQVPEEQNSFKIRKTDFVSETLKNKRKHELPYMTQFSLENRKPRRGRKPKKSDICQLILKNYGINYGEETVDLCKKNENVPNNLNEEPLNLCTKDSKIEKKITKCSLNVGMNKRKKHPKILLSEQPSSNEVNICKFKFVNGFLRERTVLSFDRPGNLISDSKMINFDLNGKDHKNEVKNSIIQEPMFNKNNNSFPINSFIQNHKKICNPFNKQEKKFEGKSFLIKTQEHLTANESVYNKFRHLKKFTRYLFKNWIKKDYLPKNMEDKKIN